jgi:hypothetical protein
MVEVGESVDMFGRNGYDIVWKMHFVVHLLPHLEQ